MGIWISIALTGNPTAYIDSLESDMNFPKKFCSICSTEKEKQNCAELHFTGTGLNIELDHKQTRLLDLRSSIYTNIFAL